ETLHFSWYNCHCTRGQDAPADVPPVMLRSTGGIKTNYHQMLPYPSKDMTAPGASSISLSLKSILGALFEWLEGKLKEMLPETYKSLDVSAWILPDNSETVCVPFIGLVINLNVVIAAH
ncbi:hypothetical protein C8Q72DRAFT_742579, partial [Fomitopsis betulina]